MPKKAKKASPKKSASAKSVVSKAAVKKKAASGKTAVKRTSAKKVPATKATAPGPAKKAAAKQSGKPARKVTPPAGKTAQPPKKKSSGKAAAGKDKGAIASPGKPARGSRKKAATSSGGKNADALKERIKRIAKSNTSKDTPAIFKTGKKATPVVFSIDEVRDYLKQRKDAEAEKVREETEAAERSAAAKKVTRKTDPEALEQAQVKKRKLGAASIADILGFSPAAGATNASEEAKRIPRQYRRNYEQLLELRDHVRDSLSQHARDTRKEDDVDRSRYGKDMADAGSDNFDKDFALSLVTNEQEALYEIEQAIRRLKNGTYGICEITGQPIKQERLDAVPFTRFSVEGQAQWERSNRRHSGRGVAFADALSDESNAARFSEDESED